MVIVFPRNQVGVGPYILRVRQNSLIRHFVPLAKKRARAQKGTYDIVWWR